MNYVDVLLPLPLEGTFTYRVPDQMDSLLQTGCRVIVPFGSSKLLTGVVVRLHSQAPSGNYQVKEITECLDKSPSVLPSQLKLWSWMSQYYLCTGGDVMKAALPSGMKLASETQLDVNEDFDNWDRLTKKEVDIYETLLREKQRTVAQLQKSYNGRDILSSLRHLMDKGALTVKEQLRQQYMPRRETHVRLAKPYLNEQALNNLSESLQKMPKRYKLLMKYLELSGVPASLTLHNPHLVQEVSRARLLEEAGISAAVLTGMKAKGYLETYDYEVGRLKTSGRTVSEQLPLSQAQQTAYDQIEASFASKPVCLLHGVTSSGKTEIYIRLIRKMIQSGKQVLYLLPEIALTTQITERLRRVFGDAMGVYHSKCPDAERVEIWRKQLSSKPFQLILGVRSSIFLPFQSLGLIIVDEEHESSYNQQDPAPRYNARDAAIMLATYFNARVLLGTATPSLESYHNAQVGKYGYARLDKRYGDILLPQIEVIDVKDLLHRKMMKLPFSPRLEEEIGRALEAGEQVILFQNRRGYTPVIECHTCGWVPTCQYCDVSLTYHRNINRLVCHYCGTSYDVPKSCPNCGGTELRTIGFGTEKIEEEVRRHFPKARTSRLDLDSARTRNSYERILDDFSKQRTDILIGTQMVSKGLDFDNVRVVGILDADTMLTRPDFRAFEHAFQMMSQVAGRAGRRSKRGYVILQTRHPDYPVVAQVQANDYEALYRQQIAERKEFGYPPFCRLIYIYIRHRDDHMAQAVAQQVALLLRQHFGTYLLGPDRPAIARVQMMYYRKLILKVAHSMQAAAVRSALRKTVQTVTSDTRYHGASIYFDVDPV